MLIVAGVIIFRSRLKPARPHSVTLSWNAPVPDSSKSKVVSYSIYRRTKDGTFAKLASDVSGLNYRDERVKAGTTYIYIVQSVNELGLESQPSAEIKVVVPED